jgi:hypothetical protein
MNRHLQEFREQGYTVLRGFFEPSEMDALIEHIRSSDPRAGHPSGLNKGPLQFYSNVFFKSRPLQEFVSQPKIVDFLRDIIGPDFWIRWDQAVAKGPGAPEFPWHQDNGYNRLKDEHYQFWVALSKMTSERGGLWVVPGSHRRGPLPHAKVGNHMAYQGPTDGAICIEAEPGDTVLFSSLLLHYTSPNVSQFDRWAYVVEYMSANHFDPFIPKPYFMVASSGKRNPQFVDRYAGSRDLMNRVRYLMPLLRSRLASWRLRAGA